MALTKKEIENLKQALNNYKNPMFFFDADADGLTAFLVLYALNREGHGIFVKRGTTSYKMMLRKIEQYNPDCIFLLDIAVLDEEFFEKTKIPIYWLDHHPTQEIKWNNVKYFNPRVHNDNDNTPTSYWAYKVTKKKNWLAFTGNVSDWHITDLKQEVIREYPDFFKGTETTAPQILFENTKLGKFSLILNLILKTKTKEVNSCVKILTRLEHYNDILEQRTSQGKFVWKTAEKIMIEFEQAKIDALEQAKKQEENKDNLMIIKTEENKYSFGSELSNILVYKYPKKFILFCTKAQENYRISLRSEKYNVVEVLNKTLELIPSCSGGGHVHACGSSVPIKEFDNFIKIIKKVRTTQKNEVL